MDRNMQVQSKQSEKYGVLTNINSEKMNINKILENYLFFLKLK